MIKIAHRGNTKGSIPELENTEKYLKDAISKGFDVEVDVWVINNEYFLGHDGPEHKTTLDFVNSIKNSAWFHCKNLDALYAMACQDVEKYFWHQKDDFTLTSNNYIWTYPGCPYGDRSIIVDLGQNMVQKYNDIYGVCGDYLE